MVRRRSQSPATCERWRPSRRPRSPASQPRRMKLLSYRLMSATKLRGRARQETRVRVSSSIAPTITYVGYTASRAAPVFSSAVAELPRKPFCSAKPCKFRAGCRLRPQPPFDARGVENAAGDLLDRALRSVERGDAESRNQRLGGPQLVAHLLLGGVAALRAALVADLLQAVGSDGQGIKLATMRLEPCRQLSGLQVFFRERIIGREHAVL